MMTARFTASVAITAGATALAFLAAGIFLQQRIDQESERALVVATTTEFRVPPEALHYWRHRYFSADYYSHGRADVLEDFDDIRTLLEQQSPFALVMSDAQFAALPDALRENLRPLGSYSKKTVYGRQNAAVSAAELPAHAAVRQ
jgi:hypothetical protein